jgi:hypothetical protein
VPFRPPRYSFDFADTPDASRIAADTMGAEQRARRPQGLLADASTVVKREGPTVCPM